MASARFGFSPLDLFAQLRGLRVVYVPNTGNSGDAYISYATFHLFNIFNVKYEIPKEEDRFQGRVILFGGGGNLIEGQYETLARKIETLAPGNECVVLPHSVIGWHDILKSENVSVFCRERESYEGLVENGFDACRVHLAHDMTFYPSEDFLELEVSDDHGVFWSLRTDCEALPGVCPPENVDISKTLDGGDWSDSQIAANATRLMLSRIARYSVIVTDRLHVAIGAARLGKKVLFGPNGYYKNKAVYEHSIRGRFERVQFYATRDELLAAGNSHQHDFELRR